MSLDSASIICFFKFCCNKDLTVVFSDSIVENVGREEVICVLVQRVQTEVLIVFGDNTDFKADI